MVIDTRGLPLATFSRAAYKSSLVIFAALDDSLPLIDSSSSPVDCTGHSKCGIKRRLGAGGKLEGLSMMVGVDVLLAVALLAILTSDVDSVPDGALSHTRRRR